MTSKRCSAGGAPLCALLAALGCTTTNHSAAAIDAGAGGTSSDSGLDARAGTSAEAGPDGNAGGTSPDAGLGGQSGRPCGTATRTYTATGTDQSAIVVDSATMQAIANAAVTSDSRTSSQDDSSFNGRNAAILVKNGGSHVSMHPAHPSGRGAHLARSIRSAS